MMYFFEKINKKGTKKMIRITSIRNIKDDTYDEVWAIVRSMKTPSNTIKQVTALAPSEKLFYQYLTLKKNNEWNKHTFATVYVPQFMKEMFNKESGNMLNYLYRQDQEGKKICLVCFCPNEKLCHRSIIAGLLQGAGCSVITDNPKTDYSDYYRLWFNIQDEKQNS